MSQELFSTEVSAGYQLALISRVHRPVVYQHTACTARVTCLVFALVSPGPAQPDLVLPEVGGNVSNHPFHADALAGPVLSRHFAGQLWLQNQTQLLSKVTGQASCQCLTPTPHLHTRSSICSVRQCLQCATAEQHTINRDACSIVFVNRSFICATGHVVAAQHHARTAEVSKAL